MLSCVAFKKEKEGAYNPHRLDNWRDLNSFALNAFHKGQRLLYQSLQLFFP
jgi:hypothetical protein